MILNKQYFKLKRKLYNKSIEWQKSATNQVKDNQRVEQSEQQRNHGNKLTRIEFYFKRQLLFKSNGTWWCHFILCSYD